MIELYAERFVQSQKHVILLSMLLLPTTTKMRTMFRWNLKGPWFMMVTEGSEWKQQARIS